jgi:hypothetical protein
MRTTQFVRNRGYSPTTTTTASSLSLPNTTIAPIPSTKLSTKIEVEHDDDDEPTLIDVVEKDLTLLKDVKSLHEFKNVMFPMPRVVSDDVAAAYGVILVTGGKVVSPEKANLEPHLAPKCFLRKFHTVLNAINVSNDTYPKEFPLSMFIHPNLVTDIVDHYASKSKLSTLNYQVNGNGILQQQTSHLTPGTGFTSEYQHQKRTQLIGTFVGMNEPTLVPNNTVEEMEGIETEKNRENITLSIFSNLPQSLVFSYDYLHPTTASNLHTNFQKLHQYHNDKHFTQRFIKNLITINYI